MRHLSSLLVHFSSLKGEDLFAFCIRDFIFERKTAFVRDTGRSRLHLNAQKVEQGPRKYWQKSDTFISTIYSIFTDLLLSTEIALGQDGLLTGLVGRATNRRVTGGPLRIPINYPPTQFLANFTLELKSVYLTWPFTATGAALKRVHKYLVRDHRSGKKRRKYLSILSYTSPLLGIFYFYWIYNSALSLC